jgi:dTDP-glucose 4,6-dehydratase/UDP-glucuronate decarboxylase
MGDRLNVLSGTTILVTGASGFLCSYFLDTIAVLNDEGLNPPCRVIAIDNFMTGQRTRHHNLEGRDDIKFLAQDVTHPLEIDQPVQWIIHGASIASPTSYRRYPVETINANVNGTWRMLELAQRSSSRSILVISSSEIYGDPPPTRIPTSEEYRGSVSCTGPRACYDESKRLAETLCYVYNHEFGVRVKTVRPFNIYGPGQRLDDRRIIPDLMSAVIHRKPLSLYSDGHATRAFCYITDAIRAMWYVLLSDANGEAFNVGNDQTEVTINQLVEYMRDVAGSLELEIEYRSSPDPHYLSDNPQRRCPNLTKIKNYFPWEPQVDLRAGLLRTLRSYQE